MTENQLKYLAYQESQRHNLAMEDDTDVENLERERANRAREDETQRSNLAKEAETKRHNVVGEVLDTVDTVSSATKTFVQNTGQTRGMVKDVVDLFFPF